MIRIGFRIIPKEREWVVKPLVDGVVVDGLISTFSSRTKAWNSIRRKTFKYHTGRKPFNLIIELDK